MPAKRAKTIETAEYFGLPQTYLRSGALDGSLKGCFFQVGRRGDRVWDWEILEQRLKELCNTNSVPEDSKDNRYGVLRKVL